MELHYAKNAEPPDYAFLDALLNGATVENVNVVRIDVLRKDNYKNIISSANTLEEAITYLKGLYVTTEGTFSAYFFNLLNR